MENCNDVKTKGNRGYLLENFWTHYFVAEYCFFCFSSDAVCALRAKPLLTRALCESLLSCTDERAAMLAVGHRQQQRVFYVFCSLCSTGEKALALKERNGFSTHVVVVPLTLIFDGSEIVQYTYRSIGQSHIIP